MKNNVSPLQKKKHAARFFFLVRLSKSLARSTLVLPRGDTAPLREVSFFLTSCLLAAAP